MDTKKFMKNSFELLVKGFKDGLIWQETLNGKQLPRKRLSKSRGTSYVGEYFNANRISANADRKIRKFCRLFVKVVNPSCLDCIAVNPVQAGRDLYKTMDGRYLGFYDDRHEPWEGYGEEIYQTVYEKVCGGGHYHFWCFARSGGFGVGMYFHDLSDFE